MHARPNRGTACGPAAAPAALLAATLLAATALLAAAPAAAAEPDGGPAVTWGVRAADNELGEARQNYRYELEPGGSLEDAIVIANHDEEAVELDVYAADGFTTESGQLDVATRDVPPMEIGAWTLTAVDRITVEPGTEVEVPFTLAVPENATPGDYAGGIITSLTRPDAEDGLSVDRRLGIRIHLRVGGELAPALAVDELHVDYAGTLNPFAAGRATVSYTVRNTGNVRLSAGQAVSITGPFGILPVAAAGLDPVPELLPGEAWPVTVPLDGVLPSFVLTATVGLEPAAAEGVDDLPALAPVEASATAVAVPWTLLALVLLLAAGIVLRIVFGRRRRARRRADEEARVQEAVERALGERDAAAEEAPAAPGAHADAPDAAPEPVAGPDPAAPDAPVADDAAPAGATT